jgi:hypothetical protein
MIQKFVILLNCLKFENFIDCEFVDVIDVKIFQKTFQKGLINLSKKKKNIIVFDKLNRNKREMDSRSKYANLPFVAIGERDVFETDEMPEPEQSSVREPLWDASIDVIACGTLEAFQRFNDNKDINFIEKVFKLLFKYFY